MRKQHVFETSGFDGIVYATQNDVSDVSPIYKLVRTTPGICLLIKDVYFFRFDK